MNNHDGRRHREADEKGLPLRPSPRLAHDGLLCGGSAAAATRGKLFAQRRKSVARRAECRGPQLLQQ